MKSEELEGTAQLHLNQLVRYLLKSQLIITDSATLSIEFLTAIESFIRNSDLILSSFFIIFSTEKILVIFCG
jgi:hypothetical protein